RSIRDWSSDVCSSDLGEWRHLRANKALAIATGVPEGNVVLAQNGVVVELVDKKASVVGQVQVGNLYVDGLSTGDVGDTVLADRKIGRAASREGVGSAE